MKSKILGYTRLARPANLPTAAADILAGFAISGMVKSEFGLSAYSPEQLSDAFCLILASVFLYAAGVILNDVFDAKLDKVERPERPIPSGLVSRRSAAIFGSLLILLGILLAFLANTLAGVVALLLAFCIVLYDGFSKKYSLIGPLNMGLCRALNLVLGMSVIEQVEHWYMGAIPLVYIFAITLVSRGEVHGDNKKHLIWAGILYAAVIFGVLLSVSTKLTKIMEILPFILLFALMVYKPLIRAYRKNSPEAIKKAVISGVLGLVVLDASLAVGFSVWWYGLMVLLLLPLSFALSKLFAVT